MPCLPESCLQLCQVASGVLPQAGEVLSMHAGQKAALCGEGSQCLVHHLGSHLWLGLQVDLDKRPAALFCTALLLRPITCGKGF